jgi:hypothetical protein
LQKHLLPFDGFFNPKPPFKQGAPGNKKGGMFVFIKRI